MNESNSPERITMETIGTYIFSVFNLEKGLLYTIKEMTIHPGQAIRDFLFSEKRNLHIKPMSFLILMVTVGTFITFKIIEQDVGSIDKNFIEVPSDSSEYIKSMASTFGLLMSKYLNLFQMLKIPFLALGTFWLFRKSKFNFAEHLVINTYIFSYTSVLLILTGFASLMFSKQISAVTGILLFVYPIYVYFRFFEENFITSLLKSILVYMIGTLLHLLFSILVVMVILFFK